MESFELFFTFRENIVLTKTVTRNFDTVKIYKNNFKNVGFYNTKYALQFNRLHKTSSQWRPEGGGGVWGVQTPPPKFRSFDKAEPNFQFRGKYIRNNLTRIRLSLIFLSCFVKSPPRQL